MGHWRDASLPVVVGIDGSSSALDAARWAAREAARRGTPLQLINAFGWSDARHIGDPGFGGHYRKTMSTSAHAAVSAATETAAQAAPGIEISGRVVDGFPVPLLTAVSRRAGLLVIGDRGLGGFTSLLVGSVAIGLAAHAECPVVVVRGEQPADTGPVVVGVDGSPVSEAALAYAFDAADKRKVPLVAVHAWTDSALDAAVVPLLGWDAIETVEQLLLAERLAGWGEKYPDVEVRRVVARDRPAHALIERAAGVWTDEHADPCARNEPRALRAQEGRRREQARERRAERGHVIEQATAAQFLVVGSHGRGSAAGLVLGSVSHAVLHHSPCPVAVVRPERTPS